MSATPENPFQAGWNSGAGCRGKSCVSVSDPVELEVDFQIEVGRNHAGLRNGDVRIIADLCHNHRLFAEDLDEG